MFGCPPRVGLVSAGIPHDVINHLTTEEDVESWRKKMEEEPNELETHTTFNSPRKKNMNTVPENLQLEIQFAETVDAESVPEKSSLFKGDVIIRNLA